MPKHIAKAKDAASIECVGYDRDHLSIAQLDRSSFTVLIQKLQIMIDNTPRTIGTNIPSTGIQLSDEALGLPAQAQLFSILQPGNVIQSTPSQLLISAEPIDYASFSNEVSRSTTFSRHEVSSLSLDLSKRLSLIPGKLLLILYFYTSSRKCFVNIIQTEHRLWIISLARK